jgi:tripartite ATP-independent transporter DctP family solute receptor
MVRGLFAVALALAAASSCAPPANTAEDWVAKLSHVYPVGSDYQLMAGRLRDLMEERTEGRFRIIIYPSGQLGGERVVFEQLQAGAVEIAISGVPVLSGWVPESQLFDLPYLFDSREQGLAVLNGPMGDWWRERLLRATGVRSLGFLDYGFRHVFNSKRPIRRASDLAGLKLRVLQSATYIASYAAFGAQPTPMSYGEVYSALQQGVIDGGEANLIGYTTDRLYEVGSYFSFTSITYNPITLLVNDRFYSSLPEDVRSALVRSVAESLAYQKEIASELEKDAIGRLTAARVTLVYPEKESFVSVVRPKVWDELADRLPGGAGLIERLMVETGRLRAELIRRRPFLSGARECCS